MSDQVKIYDSVRGTEWMVGRGYGTVTGASIKKSGGSWSNVFTTWKKKGKSSEKKTCREAFSHFSPALSATVLMSPNNHPLDPAILKFCSLSAASGHHYLSTGNHYKFSSSSGSPACDPRCQQVPCMSVRGAPSSSSPASVCHHASTGRRGSLFDWHQDHGIRCTCQHTGLRPPLSSFTSRYTPSSQQTPTAGVTDVHGTSDRSVRHPDVCPERRTQHFTASLPASHKKSSSSSSPTSPNAHKKSGKQSSTISGSFVRSLRRSTSREPFSSVSGRKSILNTEVTAYDLIRHEFSQEGDSDGEIFPEDYMSGNGVPMQSTPKRRKAPIVGHKNGGHALATSPSRPKSDYLSKNMRIGGQGVTLFSWEESLHKSTPSPEKRHHRHPHHRQEKGSAAIETTGIPDVIPEEDHDHDDDDRQDSSVSCENILLPEPDYDLSDEDDVPLKSLNLSEGQSVGPPLLPVAHPDRKSLAPSLPKHDPLSDYEIASERLAKKSILKRPPERWERDGKSCATESPECGAEESLPDARTERSKYRKTALNCMMKLKLNKRSQRKHVTFRSYKDDSLILEHINEPIPEEDETLYDDVASDDSQDDQTPGVLPSIGDPAMDGLSSENPLHHQIPGNQPFKSEISL